MKVSLSWLKQLVNFNTSTKELSDKLSLITIGVKDETPDYLELDLTYNRSDLLCLRGVAREIAAITGSQLLFSEDKNYYWSDKNLPQTPVEVEEEKLSPIQGVAKIEGLKFDKSPEEWVKKLNDSGMRTVNNIADVTNLIMLEYGQPLHSFDAGTVKNDLINVRLAKNGEEIKTLDNKLRKLNSEDIVLADTEKPLDVAGVMGGKDTEVKESTTTILLSASMFNPTMVRRTSKRLGLYSEASKRFQHGLTKTNLLQAFSAAIKMYEEMGGKVTAVTLKGNLEDEIVTVELNQEKINSLIGINIPHDQIESSLQKLGFSLKEKDGGWEVAVPYWRRDITIEEDLIEEIARMYGYEKIPAEELKGKVPEKLEQSLQEKVYSTKVSAVGLGLTEAESYSFYSSQVIKNLKLEIKNLISIANPISTETQYLRDQLWPNSLEVTARNIRKGAKEVAIFELGKVYIPRKGDLPEEPYHLAIIISNKTENPIEELIGIAQSLRLHPKGVNLTLRGELKDNFHPTRFVILEKDGKEAGLIAEVHPRIVNKFGIEQRVAVLEIKI